MSVPPALPSPASGVAARRRVGLEPFLLAALIATLLVPIVWFRYFPTEDGPAHTALASVVASLLTPGDGAIDRFYFLEAIPSPNVLATIVLVALQGPLPPLVAEKVLVAGFVAGFAVAVRYALRTVDRDAGVLALLAVPVGLGLIVHYGFYNFIAGLIMSVVTIGWWHRRFGREPDRPGAGSVAILAVMLLLTYLGHLLPFLVTLFLVAAAALGNAVSAPGAGDRRRPAAVAISYWRQVRWVLLATLPSLALLGAYATRPAVEAVGGVRTLVNRVAWLGSFAELLVTFTRREALFSVLLAGATALMVIAALRQRRRQGGRVTDGDGYLAATVILLLAFLVVPAELAGGSVVPERLALFAFVALLLWLAHFQYSGVLRTVVVVVAAVATIGIVAVRWPFYAGYDRDLAEYLSASEVIGEDATVLPLFLVEHDAGAGGSVASFRVRPLIEAGSYLTSLRGAVVLNHLHAEYPYSAAQFEPERNGRLLLGVPPGSAEPIYAVPPRVDIVSFEEVTGETVDYVILWGRRYADAETLRDQDALALIAVLDERYELVRRSSDRGLMEVYARR